MSKKIKNTANELRSLQKEAPIQLHASALSLNILFSLFPILLVVVSVLGFVGAREDRALVILDKLRAFIPPEVYSFLANTLQEFFAQGSIGIFSIGFILLLWSATRIMRSIINSLDEIYRNPRRRKLHHHIGVAILFTVIVGAILFMASNMMVWGDLFTGWLASIIPLPAIFDILILNLHWPILFIASIILLTLAYRFIPSHEEISRWSYHIPGAVLATVTWMLGSLLFNLYLSYADTLQVYGAIGIVIALIMYIQVSSYAFLFGAYINSAREDQFRTKNWMKHVWRSFTKGLT